MRNILAAAAIALGIAALAPAAHAAPMAVPLPSLQTASVAAITPVHYRSHRRSYMKRVRVCRWVRTHSSRYSHYRPAHRVCRWEWRRHWR